MLREIHSARHAPLKTLIDNIPEENLKVIKQSLLEKFEITSKAEMNKLNAMTIEVFHRKLIKEHARSSPDVKEKIERLSSEKLRGRKEELVTTQRQMNKDTISKLKELDPKKMWEKFRVDRHTDPDAGQRNLGWWNKGTRMITTVAVAGSVQDGGNLLAIASNIYTADIPDVEDVHLWGDTLGATQGAYSYKFKDYGLQVCVYVQCGLNFPARVK